MVGAHIMSSVIPTFAAIDCGTNAIRLLVADVSNGVVTDRVRLMRTVRLGEGVDTTGEFSEAALERTFAACREYADILNQYEVRDLRFIATSASRDVSNRSNFLKGVHAILGVVPDVISGTEEAELSYAGAISGLPGVGQALVADIGGGSTEFVMKDSTGSLISRSLNMGCVRMTERYLQTDPPTDQEIQLAVSDINRNLEDLEASLPIHSTQVFIGLAGSVTTVAAMAMGLESYQAELIHGSVITLEQVEQVTDELLTMTREQRSQLGFMHPGRIDVIGGGALVLRESMRILGFDRVNVSEKDLLDGVVIKLANR